MGADVSKEQEERKKAEEERKKAEEQTKQLQINLELEKAKLRQEEKIKAMEVVKKQQETQENLAMHTKFSIIHGGVTVDPDGFPRLYQTILSSETEPGTRGML